MLILALMVLAVVALLLLGQAPPPFFLLGRAAAADPQHWGQGSKHVDDHPLGLQPPEKKPQHWGQGSHDVDDHPLAAAAAASWMLAPRASTPPTALLVVAL